MSLLQNAMTECVYLNKATIEDSRGSQITTWTPGAKFLAAFELQNSLDEVVAMAQGVKGIYRVTVSRSVRLDYHDVFQRLSDGKTFQVESKDDSNTPETASINMRVVRADEWELPV